VRIQRLIACSICGLALTVLLAACATTEPEDTAELTPPELDLETLEGRSDDFGSFGTALRSPNSYVGWIARQGSESSRPPIVGAEQVEMSNHGGAPHQK